MKWRFGYEKKISIKRKVLICMGMSMLTFSILAFTTHTTWVKAATENVIEQSQVSALQLSMSKPSGCYENEFLLDLSCEGAKNIYYTTDGSNPVTSTTRKEYLESIKISDRQNEENVLAGVDPVLFDSAYAEYDYDTKKFTDRQVAPAKEDVDKATVIRAVGLDEKGLYTNVVTNTYFIGSMAEHIEGIKESCEKSGAALSIMSVSMDYDDLFDYEKGIYVKGKIFDEALANYKGNIGWNAADVARGLDANYKQRGSDWERNAHIDYIESDGKTTKCLLQQDCGIRVQGNYSRSDYQKSFRLVAKKKYGSDSFNYPFFGEDSKDDSGNIISDFKKLVLRNGGNGAFQTKYADQYWQSLFKQLKCETQASRVCVVYLDGEYWGIYILQEDYDDSYFEAKHKVNKDDVVVYKGDAEQYECGYKLDEGKLPEGVNDEGYYLNELNDFFEKHKDLKSDTDYKEFSKLVDVEDFKRYFAAQIWINNKWDWPGKNWSIWKSSVTDNTNPYADGRWRLCIYDLDFGGISGKASAADNTIQVDNYKPKGLLDMDTENPVVLSFAYLMTNKNFRTDFEKYLKQIDKTVFEKNNAVNACTRFQKIYEPLFRQFFARYFGSEDADYYINQEKNGGYGSYKCITEFIKERSKYLDNIISWTNEQYKEKKVFSKFKVTAKKGSKSIKIITGQNNTKVTVTLNKKIILNGKKKVKTLSKKTSNTGIVVVKLSTKLSKGTKITIKAVKSGYVSKNQKVTIK